MPAGWDGQRRRIPADTYLVFFGIFALLGFLTHAPFLKLPFFWDEAGQFVPAALELFRSGAWIPAGALAEAHPPGLAAFLAGVWTAAGYSIESTRIAMLLVAGAAMLVAFLLAIELCREAEGAPAFAAVAFLAVSPLFYAQSILAQLDMPAMLLTSLALLLFLQDKMRRAAAVCAALVLVKETGVLVPLVFAFWLWREQRRRDVIWFAAPVVLLAVWLGVLQHATGNLFGNPAFTRYNLVYPFRPMHLLFAVAKRIYFLGFENFHWIGVVAIVLAWRRGRFATRAWRITGLLAGAHVLLVSVLGGAVLERYLLPVMPLLYTAMATSTWVYKRRLRLATEAALIAGLIAGIFWNPPYPFPYEDNLAYTDFVALQQRAADYLAHQLPPSTTITTAWPLSAALSNPDLGYVRRPLPVHTLADFRPASITAVDWANTPVFVLYSRNWDPEWNLLHVSFIRDIWSRYYDYQPAVPTAKIPMIPAAAWSRRGQWITIYVGAQGQSYLRGLRR